MCPCVTSLRCLRKSITRAPAFSDCN
uniref:Uncharacterized protein n=1 Tax=Anguilla anguilla TaxID=7936 RepID=A0A0E9VSS5_ANGAN